MQQGRDIYNGHVQQGNKRLNEKRIHPNERLRFAGKRMREDTNGHSRQ